MYGTPRYGVPGYGRFDDRVADNNIRLKNTQGRYDFSKAAQQLRFCAEK